MVRNECHISCFASNLKTARKKQKLTQKALADKIGVSERTLINWEKCKPTQKGRSSIPDGVEILIRLSEVLDCDIDYLLGKIDVPHRDTIDVSMATGLSIEAADRLIRWNNAPNNLLKSRNQAGIDFLNEIIPKFQFSAMADYHALQVQRSKGRDDFSFSTESGADEFAEWVKKYPSAFIMNGYEGQRFLISEIAKAIELILRKELDNNEA